RLPDLYRRIIIARYFQGKTRSRLAADLGLPLGSVSRQLDRACELLRDRLTQRGITVSAALLAPILAERTAAAAVPARLLVCAAGAPCICRWGDARGAAASRRLGPRSANGNADNHAAARLLSGVLPGFRRGGVVYLSGAYCTLG